VRLGFQLTSWLLFMSACMNEVFLRAVIGHASASPVLPLGTEKRVRYCGKPSYLANLSLLLRKLHPLAKMSKRKLGPAGTRTPTPPSRGLHHRISKAGQSSSDLASRPPSEPLGLDREWPSGPSLLQSFDPMGMFCIPEMPQLSD
jgi:hypothetical protein